MTSSNTDANTAATSTLSSRLITALTAACPCAQRALYHTSLLLFAFQGQRFTVVVCRTVEYTTETFPCLTDGVAAVFDCHVPSVGLNIQRETAWNSIDLGLLAAEARASKEKLSCCCVGDKEHVSCGVRFQDVRAWSLINEKNHFSAPEWGLYSMSLDPRLTVGEKLAYDIHGNYTSIMGGAANASPLGFCVMPPLVTVTRCTVAPTLRTVGYTVRSQVCG